MKKTLLLAFLLSAAVPAISGEPPAPAATAAVPAPPPAAPRNHLLDLYVPQLSAAFLALILASEAVSRRSAARRAALRRAWNWLLLLSLFACVAIGLALLFPLAKPLKTLLTHWHVWTGVTGAWAALYHLALRAKAML
jgi:hypothetical protein